jgi:iron complex transport system substrate-binding protein
VTPATIPASWSARLLALLAIVGLVAAGCGTGDDDGAPTDASGEATVEATDGGDDDTPTDGSGDDDTPTDGSGDATPGEGSGFPVEVDSAAGTVTVPERPEAIVSLSPTATEMLFAIGAGDRVVAVDQFSNYPPEAPAGSLDGFNPDLEAILATGPDLVVTQGLPPDIEAGLVAAGTVVLTQPPASSFDDTYDQMAELGLATGEVDGAAEANASLRADVEGVLASLPRPDSPVRVFHEIDDSFYTASSNSFIGQVYAEMGFENVADALDDGSGYPLVDGESIIAADPTLIVYTDQVGYGADEISARPGWETMTAVAQGNLVQVDADVASRWGPRIVEFMEAIAAALLVDG